MHSLYGHGCLGWLSCCCSVAPASQWSTKDWTCMEESLHLTIGHQLNENPKNICRRFGTYIWVKNPRYEELTMCMAECIGLALLTLLDLRNHQDGQGKLVMVATVTIEKFWLMSTPSEGIAWKVTNLIYNRNKAKILVMSTSKHNLADWCDDSQVVKNGS